MENLENNLDDFIDGEITPNEPKEFVIDDDNKADWAVRKILERQKAINNAEQLAKERIEKINAWLNTIKKDYEPGIEFLSEKLRNYAQLKIVGKSKTVKMPSGNISFRNKTPEYFINGEKIDGKNKTLIDYVRNNCTELLIVEESADWTELKKQLVVLKDGRVLSPEGEIFSFMSAVEYQDSIDIKERK
ncbi:MAG: putative phage protein [Firmicutes bacterium]|nr:putative phage protein [Bacillota bacterium]